EIRNAIQVAFLAKRREGIDQASVESPDLGLESVFVTLIGDVRRIVPFFDRGAHLAKLEQLNIHGA
ncbi:MAG TPA: hypothetical protein VNH84_16345, partial [Candidatus Saccharimonadales bacterium]|nr:hypothetical protein [Candidatus Saccharimonadales bacterium]